MLKQLLEKQILHKISKGESVESDLEKMNFFFLREQLTGQEYDELLALIPHNDSTEVEPPQIQEVEIIVAAVQETALPPLKLANTGQQ